MDYPDYQNQEVESEPCRECLHAHVQHNCDPGAHICCDPRHAVPCVQTGGRCVACEAECDPKYLKVITCDMVVNGGPSTAYNEVHGPCTYEGCTCSGFQHYPRVEACCIKHREVFDALFDFCGACFIEQDNAWMGAWDAEDKATPAEHRALDDLTRLVLLDLGLTDLLNDPALWLDEAAAARAIANLDGETLA